MDGLHQFLWMVGIVNHYIQIYFFKIGWFGYITYGWFGLIKKFYALGVVLPHEKIESCHPPIPCIAEA